MRAPLRSFARAHKSAAGYLDLPANARGAEKGFLVHRVQPARDPNGHVIDHLTLIKTPGLVLQSLTQSIEEFNRRDHLMSDLER